MKSFFSILLLTMLLCSCLESENRFPQSWKLDGHRTYSFGGDTGFIATPDSSYTYLFRSDGTFLKTVGTETSSGSFVREKRDYMTHGKKTMYLLNFSENKLVHSCSAQTEQLVIAEDGVLSGGSAPCDGPTNYYSLQK